MTQEISPRVSTSFSGITFIQLWRMTSAAEQSEWLGAMHKNIHLLQKQPGFVSMSLHASLDGKNVVVYAQWESESTLQAAVDLPEVKAARVELDSHGEPDGTLFRVDSISKSRKEQDESLEIEVVPHRIIFVNMWTVSGRERQDGLLLAMREDATEIVSKPGALGMALHASLDGKRVAVYASWKNLQSFDAAITNDSGAQQNRERLGKWGQGNPNTYTLDSVNLPFAKM